MTALVSDLEDTYWLKSATHKLFQSQEYGVKHMQKPFRRGIPLYTALQLPSFSEHQSAEGKQLPTLLLMEKIFQGSNNLFF